MYFLCLMYLIVSFPCSSQVIPKVYSKNYSTEHGLPSPEVYCVLEDKNGAVWFGTDNGAVKFDGYEFITFGAEKGLLHNVVLDIHKDHQDRIYFGTITGASYYLEGDTILPCKYNPLIKKLDNKFDTGTLEGLLADGSSIFSLEGYGILRIDKDGAVNRFQSKSPIVTQIIHFEQLNRTIIARQDNTEDSNYDEFYNQIKYNYIPIEIILDNQILKYNLKVDPIKGSNVSAQKISKNELLIFAGRYLHYFADTSLVWSIPFSYNIISINKYDKSGFWFCLGNNSGLLHFNSVDEIKNNIGTHYFDGISITSILKSSNGSYWVTSKNKGVFYVPNPDVLIYNKQAGLPNEFVRSVEIKNKDELYIGFDNGSITHFDIKENKLIKNYPNCLDFSYQDIYYDESNSIVYQGFIKRENCRNCIPPYLNKKRIFDDNHFKSTGLKNIRPYLKNYLIASNHAGFFILDKGSHSLSFNSGSFNRERVFTAFPDNNNNIWIGTNDGLFSVNIKDSSFIRPNVSHPAFYNRIEDISQLLDGTLVVGTKGFGVVLWKDNKTIVLNTDSGLASNMVEKLHVDNNGILWIGTLQGFNKIKIKLDTIIIRKYTMSHGVPTNEIYDINTFSNRIWLCTSKGLVEFKEPPLNTFSSQPVINSIKINETFHEYKKYFKLNSHENNIELNFRTTDLNQNGNILYRFRISPDSKWSYSQSLTINYLSLGHGKYYFEIQSSNEDGVWSESLNVEFSISPPWWFRIEMWMFVVFFIGGAIYNIYSRRLKLLIKENQIQRQITKLEKSALQAQMNPHFIFNCLNSIQNFILTNDSKKAVEFLSKFAILVRLTLEASVNETISLIEEINLLETYLTLEQERFDFKFNYQIDIDDEVKEQNILFYPLLIQPYVENAILHGMIHDNRSGEIKIHFSKENDNLSVLIADNGLGFMNNINQERKSFGMSITQKRLELQALEGQHVVRIRTLKDNEGKSIGTEVKILIKIQN